MHKVKLSEAQIDLLKKIIKNDCPIRYCKVNAWFDFIGKSGYIRTATMRSLVNKGLFDSTQDNERIIYTLTPLGKTIEL
jgi:predicted transcriptional regulator